jgi:hypothetical protein
VKRTLGTTTTYYIYDGEKPIVEYTSGAVVTAKNLYGAMPTRRDHDDDALVVAN